MALAPLSLSAEEKNPGDSPGDILSRVDGALHYPDGQLDGRMIRFNPGGRNTVFDVRLAAGLDKMLYKFSSERGDELLLLINLKEEDIWAYNPVIKKLYNKRGIGRFDPVLRSGFSFIDLINSGFKKNYYAKITGNALIDGADCIKLELKPEFKDSVYGLLTLYARRQDYALLKVDFHDTSGALYKTMSISRTLDKNDKILSIKYRMFDDKNETIAILEFFSIDVGKKFNKRIFRHENMEGAL